LRIAWIYNEMVHPTDDNVFDEDDTSRMTKRGWLTINMYRFVTLEIILFFFIVPIMAIMTPFTQIAPGG